MELLLQMPMYDFVFVFDPNRFANQTKRFGRNTSWLNSCFEPPFLKEYTSLFLLKYSFLPIAFPRDESLSWLQHHECAVHKRGRG
jgi:hypothetical protein